MPYHRIEEALRICVEHIQQLDSDSPYLSELEAYLVAGVVLVIVSEYEDYIERLFLKRAEKCGDIAIINYMRTTIAQKFKSPDLGKVTEVLGKLGGNYKDQFSKQVLNTEAHAAWDNIMKARHAVVHKKSNLNITLLELRNSYPKTKDVLSLLETVLMV